VRRLLRSKPGRRRTLSNTVRKNSFFFVSKEKKKKKKMARVLFPVPRWPVANISDPELLDDALARIDREAEQCAYLDEATDAIDRRQARRALKKVRAQLMSAEESRARLQETLERALANWDLRIDGEDDEAEKGKLRLLREKRRMHFLGEIAEKNARLFELAAAQAELEGEL
jgi:hypothetical protein